MREDLQTKLAAAEAEVKRLKKEIGEAESRWPRLGDDVWIVLPMGESYPVQFDESEFHSTLLVQNGMFRTKQEADHEGVLRQMRSGVRVLERGREYWEPVYRRDLGVVAETVENVHPIFLLAGVVFETEEECEDWIAKWGGTLKGVIP